MDNKGQVKVDCHWVDHTQQILLRVCSECPCLPGCDLFPQIMSICQDIDFILNSVRSEDEFEGAERYQS